MIERAVMKVLEEDLKGVAAGQMGYSTSDVGDLIVDFIEASDE
jgi:3-isopropylmalate dehydrogenase